MRGSLRPVARMNRSLASAMSAAARNNSGKAIKETMRIRFIADSSLWAKKGSQARLSHRAGITQYYSIVVVFPFRCPIHRDTTVQAVWSDVVGRQGHQRMVVMRIHGHRMRSPRWEDVWLSGGVDRRNDLNQGLPLRVDHTEHGACGVSASRDVITSVATVKPYFVGSSNTLNCAVDCARFGVHNNLSRRSGIRIRRAPRRTGSIEHHAAADEQVLVRTERESGRPAELDRKQCIHAAGVRIDSRYRAVFCVGAHLRY